MDPERAYAEALSAAKTLPAPRLADDTIVVYGRGGLAPAHTLYISLLHAGLRAQLAPATEASVHVLPYRETGPVVIYTRDPRDLRALNAAMAATHLGLRVSLVAPRLHEAVEEQLDVLGVERILVPGKAPPLLTMTVASVIWTPQLMGAREARVRAEIDALHEALDWVSRAFHGVLPAAREAAGAPPLYTPTTLPGAAYHGEAVGERPLPLEEADSLARGDAAVAYVAGVERHDYKDVLMRARLRGVRIVEIPLDTDPVTATLYSVLAAMLVTGRIL